MRIAAITKFKHGGLFELMRKLKWSARDLSRNSGVSYIKVLRIFSLERRPSETEANKIQAAFGEAGHYFDVTQEWPEAFKGFGKSVTVEQVRDVDPEKLISEGAQNGRLELEIEILNAELAKLPPKLICAIEKRWGLDGREETFKQIGDRFGVSDTRARDICKRAEWKLHRGVRRAIERLDNIGK